MKPLTVMAWDTASACCSVALERYEADGTSRNIGHFMELEAGVHSKTLPLTIETMLKKAGLKVKDIDLLAVGRGPGSFTGLRTGLALSKGLAMGLDIPLIALPTLSFIASKELRQEDGKAAKVLAAPLIDARHQEVFTALYEIDSNKPQGLPCEIMPPRPVKAAEIVEVLTEHSGGREILLVGPALDIIKDCLALGEDSIFSTRPFSQPDASELARLAYFLWVNDSQAPEKYPPIPMYIRQPDIRKSGIAMR